MIRRLLLALPLLLGLAHGAQAQEVVIGLTSGNLECSIGLTAGCSMPLVLAQASTGSSSQGMILLGVDGSGNACSIGLTSSCGMPVAALPTGLALFTLGSTPITAGGTFATIAGLSLTGANVLLGAGAVGTPTLRLGSDTNSGWYQASANVWNFAASGALMFTVNGNNNTILASNTSAQPFFYLNATGPPNRVGLAANTLFGWTASSSDATAALDTVVSRKAAAVTQFGTTAANDLGTVDATLYQAAGTSGVSCTVAVAGATIQIKGGIVVAFTGC